MKLNKEQRLMMIEDIIGQLTNDQVIWLAMGITGLGKKELNRGHLGGMSKCEWECMLIDELDKLLFKRKSKCD